MLKISKSKVMILLAERGLSVSQAAGLIGMKPNNFSALLSRGFCMTTTIGKVAAALDVPVTSVIED